jgi:hypothetical protein
VTVDRTNGLQVDKFQGHKLTIKLSDGSFFGDGFAGSDTVYVINAASTGSKNKAVADGILTDGTNGTPRTGKSTFPVNRLVRVWKRTA